MTEDEPAPLRVRLRSGVDRSEPDFRLPADWPDRQRQWNLEALRALERPGIPVHPHLAALEADDR